MTVLFRTFVSVIRSFDSNVGIVPTPMAPPDTRTRILDAAEHLFAERGFRGTSVRAITDLAGANLAAVGTTSARRRNSWPRSPAA